MSEEQKKAYAAPRLTAFGSVRNLTGGSAIMGADGDSMMSRFGAMNMMGMMNFMNGGFGFGMGMGMGMGMGRFF